MIILYKAFDGKIFENEYDCLNYENKQFHPYLKNIECYTINNVKYSIDNINDDDVYFKAEKVIIHNDNEFNDFIWLAKYNGWCEFYELITKPGIWTRHEDKMHNGYWKLLNTKGDKENEYFS